MATCTAMRKGKSPQVGRAWLRQARKGDGQVWNDALLGARLANLRPRPRRPAAPPSWPRGWLTALLMHVHIRVTGSLPALSGVHGVSSITGAWWRRSAETADSLSETPQRQVGWAFRGAPPGKLVLAAATRNSPIRGQARARTHFFFFPLPLPGGGAASFATWH